MFTVLGQQIQEQLGSPAAWVVGYANGYEGYAPTADRFAPASGDYAAHLMPLLLGRHPFTAALPRKLVEGLVEIARRAPA
jgi:hypothetical protein